MKKVVFKNLPEIGTPICKAMYWYVTKLNAKREKNDLICLDAKLATELYENEMSEFFKKYPDEIWNKVHTDFFGNTDITKEESELFEKELKI